MHARDGCAELLPHARALLATFDIVGLTGCIAHVLETLERRMGLPADSEAVTQRRRSMLVRGAIVPLLVKPKATFKGDEAHSAESNWTWGSLDGAARARVWSITQCDRQLYADAVRLANRSLHARNGCAEALLAATSTTVQWSSGSTRKRIDDAFV